MRALITGGTGFIGSHVVDALLANGFDVRCLVRPTSNLQWLQSPRIELVQGGLSDTARLEQVMQDVQVVVHVAGSLIEKSWQGFYDANVEPVRALLETATRLKRPLTKFVLVSSTGAAGPSSDGRPLLETDPENPVSSYGRSKLEGEKVARQYFDRVPVTIIRPSAVYGPRDPNFIRFFKMVRSGLWPMLGVREHYLNLIHVEDLAAGILAAISTGASTGQTYTLASLTPYKRSELMATIGQVMGRRAIPLPLPERPAVRLAKLYATFQVRVLKKSILLDPERLETLAQRYWVFDVSKAVRDLGFREQYTLQEGMRQTYEWYLEQGWMERPTPR